jgi:F-type H+-transporting ATPase subunit delta
MTRKVNPRRYAQAVFEIAQENKELDKWQSDLQMLAAAAGEGSFLDVMENPKIGTGDKARFLKAILRGISPLGVNLVLLLSARSSVKLIKDIAVEYKARLDKQRGVEEAAVITAVPLDDNDKEKLKAHLGAVTGTKIELKTEVDPAILGGIVARVGGKLLDGSTRTKLAVLKRDLEGRT